MIAPRVNHVGCNINTTLCTAAISVMNFSNRWSVLTLTAHIDIRPPRVLVNYRALHNDTT